MEAAGLAVGVVAIIKPLCTTISNTLASYKSFGSDAERLRLRFAVSQTRLEAFERVLFSHNKFPGMSSRLADHMPERTMDDIAGLLRQLYALLVEYAAVRERYQMDAGGVESSTDLQTMSAKFDSGAIAKLYTDKRRGDALQQKAVAWTRKALWATFDKSSTEKLVGEFEAWTGRMQALLEAAAWPMIYFQGLERIRKLESDVDMKSAGLLAGVGVRKVLAAGETSVPAESHAEEVAARRFTVVETGANGLDLGSLQGLGGRRLVEYKSYQPGSRDAAVLRQRVVQLAALLHEAPQSDPGLMVPRCTHYFEDSPKSRFGLVYDIPTTTLCSNGAHPVTLASILDAAYSGNRPSLSSRMRLAHKLALCVQRLHAYSWVHKSLRSENILLFPPEAPGGTKPDAGEQPTQSLDAPDRPSKISTLDILINPRVVGFEYSRQESDFSDRYGDEDIRRNVYRHPTRWGEPTKRFEKIHDVYGEQMFLDPPAAELQANIQADEIPRAALGVILLEIGLWSRVDQLDKGNLMKPPLSQDATAAQKRFLRHAEARLGFYTGDLFKDAVLGCLAGKYGAESVVEAFSKIVDKIKSTADGISG